LSAVDIIVSSIANPTLLIFAFMKPFMDSLVENNCYLQVGSTLCFVRSIENATDIQLLRLFQRILLRIVKLLCDQNFMGKSTCFFVVGSIVDAVGASTQQELSGLILLEFEALQRNEWATRKAFLEGFKSMFEYNRVGARGFVKGAGLFVSFFNFHFKFLLSFLIWMRFLQPMS
jgi:hypothetical protein